MQPTFIGIGAQKCASTWIYDILWDHPDVVLSETKEIDFFSFHYDHGLQWYLNHFKERPGARAIGEISPSYFHEPAVPGRMKRHCPDAKILVSLRDPVQRAISNHRHEIRVKHFTGTDLSFEAGLANNPMYIEQGLYATHLSRWLEHFPASQMLIVLFDEVVADPADVAKRIYRFLGLEEDHCSQAVDKQSNPGHINRYPKLEAFRNKLYQLAKGARMDRLWQTGGRLGLREIYRRVNKLPPETVIPPIPEHVLQTLRTQFAEEVIELEKILGRSLSQWR